MNLCSLLRANYEPSLQEGKVRDLVDLLLWLYSPNFAEEVAEQLLALLPPSEGEKIWACMSRLGYRLAYGIVKQTFPDIRADADRHEELHRFLRLVWDIDAALQRRKAIGHQVLPAVIRDRVVCYVPLVLGVRDLSMQDELNLGLQGCLIERMIIAATGYMGLALGITEHLLQATSAANRKRLVARVETTIPEAMANPYEIEAVNRDPRQGFMLWEALLRAEPVNLQGLLQQIRERRDSVHDEHTRPQFARPLVSNERFSGAAHKWPRELSALLL